VSYLNILLTAGSAATFLRCGGKYCIGIVGNLVLFPSVNKFWESVNNWRSYYCVDGGWHFGSHNTNYRFSFSWEYSAWSV